MALYKDLRYENEIDRVKGLQFSILSPEEILARSVCEVTAPELFNGAVPVESGLFDTRMGVIDHGRVCRTCEQRNTACPGHFGSITLAHPVHYVQFFEIVKKLLRCVCFRCSKLLLDIERPEVKAFLAKKSSRQKRWDFMYKLVTAKTLRCGTQTIDGCGAQQPNKITKEGVFKIAMEWTDTKAFEGEEGETGTDTTVQRKLVLSAEDVLRILRRITDIDADALGFSPKFSRPEWLICTVLPVPPPAVRPSVRNEGGQRCEDDLTLCLLHIVKTNNTLKQKMDKAPVDALVMLLQTYVAALVDNSASGAMTQMTQRTGRPLRALMDRLKGKEGRIRGNLVGKRVDHSARSVITPDPNISIDELGVPRKIAMNLTFPEVVNTLNRHRLKELVENGPKVYPGAKFLRKRSDGRVISLANVPDRPMLELEPGDVVDRHLQNGDYVLFNRQPSLHKMSMMAHRVRVMPYNTFRLNVCVTPTFNADFDGDEMNMHVPQSMQTLEELQQLAAVPKQIITPRESKPIISVVQDITLGVYKISQANVRITEKAMFNLIASNPRLRVDLWDSGLKDKHGNRVWSGRDALSTVIPPSVNLDLKNNLYDNNSVDDNRVVVRNGRILQGVCDKSIFQAKTVGLVHSIFNENGSEEARLFFDNTQKLICDWLAQYGFSVGISDLVVDRDTLTNVKEIISKSKEKVYDAIWQVHSGNFENLSVRTNAEQFEQVVNAQILNQAVDSVGKAARSRIGTKSNRMLDMIQSQAKGSIINFAQMIGCLGQQTVDGKRIQYGFENRTLPHFTKYDDSPDARGFVSNSFISGLTPEEFFFHAMGGREGLIDTAVKTSESGYIQRKLVKAMEDLKVCHDYTVRDTNGSIVQFLFGEDGVDPIRRESQPIWYVDKSVDVIQAEYVFQDNLKEDLEHILTADAFKRALATKDKWVPRVWEQYMQIREDRRFLIQDLFKGKFETKISYPIAFKRILENIKGTFREYGGDRASDLTPLDVIEAVDEVAKELYVCKNNPGNRFLQLLLRCHLAPKPLLLRYRLNKTSLEHLLLTVKARFYESLAQPGEMVGVVAAQSIGEPTTQLSVWLAHILVRKPDGSMFHGLASELVDTVLAANAQRVISLGNDSVVMDMPDGLDYFIAGVGDDEKTSWRRISQMSRHPANGRLVRVYTKSGKETCATLSHSFLKRTESSIVPVLGSELKEGDRIPVARYLPQLPNPLQSVDVGGKPFALTRDFGWICGAYIADGWITSNVINISKKIPEYFERIREFAESLGRHMNQAVHANSGVRNSFAHDGLAVFFGQEFGNGSFSKHVPAWAFNANMDFIAGLVGGWFDGDGNVNSQRGKQMVRAASVSKRLVEDMTVLLSFFGIFASICVEHKYQVSNVVKSSNGGTESHLARTDKSADADLQMLINGEKQSDQYCPQISRKYAKIYKERIGFIVKHKAASLDEIIQYLDRDNAHDVGEEIDKIPELGNVIAFIGDALNYSQKSRVFKRWAKKESIGRRTLEQYIDLFERTMHWLVNSDDMKAILESPSATPEAKKEAVRVLDERLGNVTDKDPYGPTRTKRYVTMMEDAARRIPEVLPKLAVLRQAANSDVVWDEIVKLEYLEDPQEMVYDFTVPGNDSFMVDTGVLVHNTLNSVHYDTELLIQNAGGLERVQIGEYIDAQLEKAATEDVEHHPNDQVLAWLRGPDVKILSCDEDGRVAWQKIEAVTRHPVVNADGTDTLLKVTTHSGREVIATKGKSFLKRINNKIVPVDGKDLVVGDYLPVSTILPTREVAPVDFLDVSSYLSMEEWLYKSEVDKALELREQIGGKWWKHQGSEFTVPYNRADSVLAAFIGQPKRPPTNTSCRSGCVYPKKTMGESMISHVPERIPLDEDFGWLVGAYLSEGCLAIGANKKGAADKPYAVLITNMSQEFHDRFVQFCDKYSLGYHIDKTEMKMPSGKMCPKVTLRMHSLVMGTLFHKMIGHGAAVKRIPPFMFGAPDVFLKALIDGYYSGDGTFREKQAYMSSYSVSRGLLDDLQQVLTRFGIRTRIKQMSEESHAKIQARYPTAKRGWTMALAAVDTRKFRDTFKLCLQRKQDVLSKPREEYIEYSEKDVVPQVTAQQFGTIEMHRSWVARMATTSTFAEDRQVFQKIMDEEVFYDQIVTIEEIYNDHPWVYDFTVADTRNFNLYSGLAQRDSFHLSGYSGASEAVRGVPRLKELLQVSKAIKTPTMKIFINPDYSQDKNKAQDIKNMLETTYLRDLVTSCSVFYDPDDTALPQDKPFVDLYRAWRSENEGLCPPPSSSPWVLRLEFDRAKMLDTNTTMLDVERMLMLDYDKLSCMFSDDNAAQLVARVRLMEGDEGSDDMLMELKALEHSLMETLAVKGVPGILKTAMNKREYEDAQQKKPVNMFDKDADQFHKTHEWVIDTAGTNLREVLANPYIDSRRTISNDIVEIYGVLGIEATRQALYDEIMEVLSDAYVNYCHVALLVDTMTTKGGLSSINRHGINRTDIGPLAKSSFEMTNDVLVKAGVFAEHDRMTGVSANVMLGQIPKYGTGDTDIYMDAEALSTAMPLRLPTVAEEVEDTEAAAAATEDTSEPVAADAFKMEFDFNAR